MTGAVTATRLWALEPATYRSPAQVVALGDAAPRIPFPIYLVEHADGLVLFDAGLDPDHAGDPAGAYGEMAERIDMDFRAEHLIEHQLAGFGFSIDDVSTVVASHLHFDHAGALKRFAHVPVIVGAGELEYARAPEKFARSWFREEDFADRHGIDWHEIETDHDLFGDGAVVALVLPGHTPGSLALQVRLPSRTIVLSGDVLHTRAALEAETAYAGDVDCVAARRSLRRLSEVLAGEQTLRGVAAELWIAHDPDDWQRLGGAGALC